MRTSDGSATDQITICFAYVAGNTQIAGTYLGGTDSGDGTLLLGCSSTSTAVGLTYSFKLYNVDTGTWTTISDRKGQWASYAPPTGTYWAHYELYTVDGRLADTRTYAFNFVRPRRALCIGTPASLSWAGNNLDSIGNMFANTSFLGSGRINTSIYRNQGISNITSLFQNTFSSTRDGDISYVYITCHSGSNDKIYIANNDAYITTKQLRQLCDTYIKGKVVVMLDTCFSGQVIATAGDETSAGDQEFVDNFINEFATVDYASSNNLASDRFYVLCSSLSWQPSIGWTYGNGFATKYWEYGAGWNPETNTICSLKADINFDSKVTMSEMYNYSYSKILAEAKSLNPPLVQNIKFYPSNSNFVIFGRY